MQDAIKVLNRYGWNTRILTFDDFLTITKRERICVVETQMRWKGLYFPRSATYRHFPGIMLNSLLRGLPRTYVAFHELGHYLTNAPGLRQYEDCNLAYEQFEFEAHSIAAVAMLPRPLFDRYSFYELAWNYEYPCKLVRLRQKINILYGI